MILATFDQFFVTGEGIWNFSHRFISNGLPKLRVVVQHASLGCAFNHLCVLVQSLRDRTAIGLVVAVEFGETISKVNICGHLQRPPRGRRIRIIIGIINQFPDAAIVPCFVCRIRVPGPGQSLQLVLSVNPIEDNADDHHDDKNTNTDIRCVRFEFFNLHFKPVGQFVVLKLLLFLVHDLD